MPNFWTRTEQQIHESIHGPRTKDIDFSEKLKEMERIRIGMIDLKRLVNTFMGSFEQISSYNQSITKCVYALYNSDEKNNGDFSEFSEALVSVHAGKNNEVFSKINEEISGLKQVMRDWDEYFSPTKKLLDIREEARKDYDHYEAKLDIMMKDKKSNDDVKMTRNEGKYLKAKDHYINCTKNAFKKIDSLVTGRFKLINPVLMKLFKLESKIFSTFNDQYSKYKDLNFVLEKLDKKYKQVKTGYNPRKFMNIINVAGENDNDDSDDDNGANNGKRPSPRKVDDSLDKTSNPSLEIPTKQKSGLDGIRTKKSTNIVSQVSIDDDSDIKRNSCSNSPANIDKRINQKSKRSKFEEGEKRGHIRSSSSHIENLNETLMSINFNFENENPHFQRNDTQVNESIDYSDQRNYNNLQQARSNNNYNNEFRRTQTIQSYPSLSFINENANEQLQRGSRGTYNGAHFNQNYQGQGNSYNNFNFDFGFPDSGPIRGTIMEDGMNQRNSNIDLLNSSYMQPQQALQGNFSNFGNNYQQNKGYNQMSANAFPSQNTNNTNSNTNMGINYNNYGNYGGNNMTASITIPNMNNMNTTNNMNPYMNYTNQGDNFKNVLINSGNGNKKESDPFSGFL